MIMDKFPAGQIIRSNRTFPIHVTDYGRWGSDDLPGGYTAGSRDELEKKIIQYVKETAVKVAVPFVQLHQTHSGRLSVRHGTATGIHGNTGNVLVQWADGKREQVRSFGSPGVSTLRGLPADKIHEWAELTKRAQDAVRALREFEQTYKIDIEDEIKSRQRVAVDEK
jgi:hypothetical protein